MERKQVIRQCHKGLRKSTKTTILGSKTLIFSRVPQNIAIFFNKLILGVNPLKSKLRQASSRLEREN